MLFGPYGCRIYAILYLPPYFFVLLKSSAPHISAHRSLNFSRPALIKQKRTCGTFCSFANISSLSSSALQNMPGKEPFYADDNTLTESQEHILQSSKPIISGSGAHTRRRETESTFVVFQELPLTFLVMTPTKLKNSRS